MADQAERATFKERVKYCAAAEATRLGLTPIEVAIELWNIVYQPLSVLDLTRTGQEIPSYYAPWPWATEGDDGE